MRRFDSIGSVLACLACTLSPLDAPAAATAVEYFHAEFAHYFVTSTPDEIGKLDDGKFAGWARTGYSFSVADDASGGALPVCRFFSTAFAPKSSHFYTPYAAECAGLQGGGVWDYEGTAFYLTLPSGTCAGGAAPIYRLYNDGMGGAPNHRYTAVRTVFDAMRAQGWTAEGDGVTGVFACGPAPPGGDSTVISLFSLPLGTSYEITIDVPPGYHPNIDPLPVIYALDAQYRLTTLRDVMSQVNARAILVAIADMGQRQRDFNVPGAVDYLAFLTNNVIPYVEANYRADPRKRVLSGHSTGGNFPFHALYLESPGKWAFAHYWSTEGAFFQQAQAIDMEEQAIFDAVGSAPFPRTLILARGSDALSGPGGSTNADVVKALYDKLAARHYNGLRLLAPAYQDADHGAADAPAFAYGLSVLFGGSAQ